MLESFKNVIKYSAEKKERLKDSNYSGRGGASAITLGARTMGGSRGLGYSTGGTFDYISTAENTIECYYQKLDDLRYYESHALTEKIVSIFRDYITQLWKEGSEIVDVPGEDPETIGKLNKELDSLDVVDLLMKDLNSVIFYGSVSYEISRMDDKDPNYKGEGSDKVKDRLEIENDFRNKYSSKDKPADRKYSDSGVNITATNYYSEIEKEYSRESETQRAKRLVESTSPEVQNIVNKTSPASDRGKESARDLQKLDNSKLNSSLGSPEAPSDSQQKVGSMDGVDSYQPVYRLNKLKSPHHTIVEYDRKQGRRYLVKATEKYHIPSNKHQIFYYGNDTMRLVEHKDINVRGKNHRDSKVSSLIGSAQSESQKKERYSKLGIDPKDPKKTPTRYELLEREISSGIPLFYHHLPQVRELFLKDLVTSILGIKDVIQPDILALNFEGGTDIDHAQDLCGDLEDLLNKNSDYSMFNSAALDYNDLTKLLIDSFRVLPDIEGKLQSINPIIKSSLQDKIQNIRAESKDLERDILSSLGIPLDLFEGQSSKWEVIKRSERLQSRVDYYINTIKGSIRRLAQSVFFLQNNRELKASSFKVTCFNESDLEIAQRSNKLQNLTELSQSLLQIVLGAERELAESKLINKEAYFKLLKSNLKEIYPEVEDLLDIDAFIEHYKNAGQAGGYEGY